MCAAVSDPNVHRRDTVRIPAPEYAAYRSMAALQADHFESHRMLAVPCIDCGARPSRGELHHLSCATLDDMETT